MLPYLEVNVQSGLPFAVKWDILYKEVCGSVNHRSALLNDVFSGEKQVHEI